MDITKAGGGGVSSLSVIVSQMIVMVPKRAANRFQGYEVLFVLSQLIFRGVPRVLLVPALRTVITCTKKLEKVNTFPASILKIVYTVKIIKVTFSIIRMKFPDSTVVVSC